MYTEYNHSIVPTSFAKLIVLWQLKQPKWFLFPLITIIIINPLSGRASEYKSSIKQAELHM